MSAADFTLLAPIAITDAILTSTNVAEAVVTAYAGGTTYALGNLVSVATGTRQDVYKSLQNSNTAHAPASSPTWWEFMSTVYTAYSAGTTYAAGDIVSNIGADVHKLYRSNGAANLGNALTNTTYWTDYGTTNARAMFDTTYGSQTSNADTIVIVLTPNQIINSLFFGNCDLASIRVQQSVSGYDVTTSLNAHLVNNWYDWYYIALTRISDLASIGNLPPYPASTLTITLSNIGGIAKCGLLAMGVARIIGLTQWEALAGMISYNGTTTDAFGNTAFLARSKVKKLNLDVRITPGGEDIAAALLMAYSDAPLVVVASTDYQIASIYCYLYSWNVPLSNKGKNAAIELRGLT
jgi:hypothetical protein